MSRKKILIILGSLLVVVFIVVPLFLFFREVNKQPTLTGPEDNTIIIDNKSLYDRGLDAAVFSSITRSAYRATIWNTENPEKIYRGMVRENTFKRTKTAISFILDIPTLKISWSVVQMIDLEGGPVSDSLVACITSEKSIYPILDGCIDRSNVIPNIDNPQTSFFELLKSLPLAGESYRITYTASPTKIGNYALEVTYYEVIGQKDALGALRSLGFDPSNYEIVYINKIR